MQCCGSRLLCSRTCYRSLSAGTRCNSTGAWDGTGQPPWAPMHVPGGATFWGMSLTKMQNKIVWRKRMQKVNRIWQDKFIEQKRLDEKHGQRTGEPPKLWLVVRVKSLGGRPYWEKDLMAQLGFDGETFTPLVLENKGNINMMLKQVKHLVDIRPISFPYGLPQSEDDYEHCYLRDNGEFVVPKTVHPAGEEKLLVSKEDPTTIWDIKQDTIDQALMRKKLKYNINKEFFPSQYIWKRNEDGKEYRYKGNSNVGYAKKWY